MLKNIFNIFRSTPTLRSFSQNAIPSIKKTFEKEENNNSKAKYTNSSTTSNSLLLMASVALFLQKYKEAKCFFGRKASKDDLDSFISCSQYPANNPIEDRYAYGKLSSVDGFAAGVFDGHGGWQVCKLISGIRIQINYTSIRRGIREDET